MTASELFAAVHAQDLPEGATSTERGLWLAGCGRWEAAHDIVESLPEPAASWIHACLHRDEGDKWNAGYWYDRAKKPMPADSVSIREEWEQLVTALVH